MKLKEIHTATHPAKTRRRESSEGASSEGASEEQAEPEATAEEVLASLAAEGTEGDEQAEV